MKKENYIEMSFPSKRQKYDYDCGVACIESVLIFYGFSDFGNKVEEITKVNRSKGVSINDIRKVCNVFDLKYKTFTNLSIDDLKDYINWCCPIIIAIQAYSGKSKTFQYSKSWIHGHYVIPIGYDDDKEIIYFQDPSSNNRTFLTYKELNERWHDQDVKGEKVIHFGFVIFGKTKTKYVHMK